MTESWSPASLCESLGQLSAPTHDTGQLYNFKARWNRSRLELGKMDAQTFETWTPPLSPLLPPIRPNYKWVKLLHPSRCFLSLFAREGPQTRRGGGSPTEGSEVDSYSSSLFRPQEWFHSPVRFAKPDSSYQQSTSSSFARPREKKAANALKESNLV